MILAGTETLHYFYAIPCKLLINLDISIQIFDLAYSRWIQVNDMSAGINGKTKLLAAAKKITPLFVI